MEHNIPTRQIMSSALLALLLHLTIPCSVQAAPIQRDAVTSTPHDGHKQQRVEWHDPKNIPKLNIRAVPSGESAWVVLIGVNNFIISPDKAGKGHVPGMGHFHLYVDGQKTARLYGVPYYLKGLDHGTHELLITLNSNNHGDYHENGELLHAKTKIFQEFDSEDVSKAIRGTNRVEMGSDPSLSIDLTRDPVKGWNLSLKVEKFFFSHPGGGSEKQGCPSGYAQLYINKCSVTRLYGGVFHLSKLMPGSNLLEIVLCSNDQIPYTHNGDDVSDFILNFTAKIDTANGSIAN